MKSEPDTIFLDTETTGLPLPDAAGVEKQPSIIEYCFTRGSETLTALVQPPFRVSAKITQITGITNDQLVNEKPFRHHFDEIARFCKGGQRWVAHNMPFDSRLIKFEMQRLGKEYQFPWPLEYYCTLERARALPEYLRPAKNNLATLYEHVTGESLKGAHRADVDVDAMIVVYKWIHDMEKKVKEAS